MLSLVGEKITSNLEGGRPHSDHGSRVGRIILLEELDKIRIFVTFDGEVLKNCRVKLGQFLRVHRSSAVQGTMMEAVGFDRMDNVVDGSQERDILIFIVSEEL